MRKVSDKICSENQITFYIPQPFAENLAVYENVKKKYD
jgi:hypothetical protein